MRRVPAADSGWLAKTRRVPAWPRSCAAHCTLDPCLPACAYVTRPEARDRSAWHGAKAQGAHEASV